jgi:hypothetical protein
MRIAWFALFVTACGSSTPPAGSPKAEPPAAAAASSTPAATAPGPAAAAGPASPYLATERRPVTDSYGEVRVVDEYRWLEDGKDPKVVAWTAAQNQLTRGRLDALPDRPKIRARVAELLSSRAPSYGDVAAVGAGVLARKRQPPKQQDLLVALRDPASAASERVVLDPNELDPSGHTTMDWFVASLDGKRVGVSLSLGGSESGDVHIYEIASGKALPDVVPHVNGGTAGGSMAWNAGGTGFWYTRYLEGGRAPRRGSRVLPADLLSQAGHDDDVGRLRARQGLPADRRGQAAHQQGRPQRARDGGQRRRQASMRCMRSTRAVTARRRGANLAVRRQDHRRRVRPRWHAVFAVAPGVRRAVRCARAAPAVYREASRSSSARATG